MPLAGHFFDVAGLANQWIMPSSSLVEVAAVKAPVAVGFSLTPVALLTGSRGWAPVSHLP